MEAKPGRECNHQRTLQDAEDAEPFSILEEVARECAVVSLCDIPSKTVLDLTPTSSYEVMEGRTDQAFSSSTVH